MPTHPAISPKSRRRSFSWRLLLAIGTVLFVVFSALGIVSWLTLKVGLTVQARSQLSHEAEEILSNIVVQDALVLNQYSWNELHHLYFEARIDPYFIQVFDASRQLVRASINITQFPEASYPTQLLATSAEKEDIFTSLKTFRAGSLLLYYQVDPIHDEAGNLLGYLQIARYEPGIGKIVRRVMPWVVLGLLVVMGILLLLSARVASSVLYPLRTITREARSISPKQLGRRITIPEKADQETTDLANTLNTLLDRLENTFNEMQQFTTNAAHELQTPLTVLKGHVEVALLRPRSVASYQETLQVAAHEIEHMSRMVRGLLTLSRLNVNMEFLEMLPVDLSSLVQSEVDAFRVSFASKGLALHVDLEKEIRVQGHEDLLREVVTNLVDNARKYTDAGSITVSLTSEKKMALLTVADTGRGILPEDLPHVTERFYRSSQATAQDVIGFGLGLALVGQIVALHQGTLDIASEPGAGTTVRVLLPVLKFIPKL